MKLLPLLLAIALALTVSAAPLDTDLCIYGGKSARVIAAM